MVNVVKSIITNLKNEVQLFVVEPPSSYNKTLLVIGGIHPDEWQAEPIVRKMMELDSKNRVLYIPCLNPDGDDIGRRMNANGVDLNRNFPAKNWRVSDKDRYFGGESPLSEIESQFLDEVIKEYQPDAVLTLHTPFELVNYDGPAQEIAEGMAKLSGYKVDDDIGYETPGSFGTYYGKEQGIPIITLEMSDEDNIDSLWVEVKESLQFFLDI